MPERINIKTSGNTVPGGLLLYAKCCIPILGDL